MDYKSVLTRDYKNVVQPFEQKKQRLRLSRLHVLLIVISAAIITGFFTLASVDVQAKKPLSVLQEDQQQQPLILPIEIPGVAASQTETQPFAADVDNDQHAQTNEPDTRQWLQVKVKSGDSLAEIFRKNRLGPTTLHEIMQLGGDTKNLTRLHPGQLFKFRLDNENNLQELIFEKNQLEQLHVMRDGEQFVARYQHKNVEKRSSHATGTITSSLFEAGRAANISDTLTMELAGIFGWDIDFALDIRAGDHFTVIFEEHFLNGKKIADGPILAAEFVNQNQKFRAIRFTDKSGRSDYYSPKGLSMRKAFLRTPVDFRRISSRFGKRHHPVLNRMRMHKGVDYAAPRGTPVKAAGDGKIVYRGRKGGYGNTVILTHGGRYSTLYAHMSSYKRGLYVGKRVKQGQTIGYVGSTGRATGPHLHYEFRVNGVHRNPLTVSLPNAAPIHKKYREAFTSHAETMISQLDIFTETSVALNRQ